MRPPGYKRHDWEIGYQKCYVFRYLARSITCKLCKSGEWYYSTVYPMVILVSTFNQMSIMSII